MKCLQMLCFQGAECHISVAVNLRVQSLLSFFSLVQNVRVHTLLYMQYQSQFVKDSPRTEN